MPDFLCPRIRSCYEYQPNSLMCWAAVALTLWRWKHGRGGRGASFDTLFAGEGRSFFRQMLDYQTELAGEIGNNDLRLLPQAEQTVRRRFPQFAATPNGLPSGMAPNLFIQGLGGRQLMFFDAGMTPAVEGEEMKTRLRQGGPIAIFPTNIGHLKLIVGYWDAEQPSIGGPQLLMFDPEAMIHARQHAGASSTIMPGVLAEERVLWMHWKRHYLPHLAYGSGWQL